MTRWTSVAGLLLVAGCTFGVDGELAVTEVGLVSAESFRIDDVTTRGYADEVKARSDRDDLVILFARGETTGELRFSDLRRVITEGGHGVLRLRDADGRTSVRRVALSSPRDRQFLDPEVRIDFETLPETQPNVQAARGVEDVDGVDVEGKPVETPENVPTEPTITRGSVLLLVEPRGYGC